MKEEVIVEHKLLNTTYKSRAFISDMQKAYFCPGTLFWQKKYVWTIYLENSLSKGYKSQNKGCFRYEYIERKKSNPDFLNINRNF